MQSSTANHYFTEDLDDNFFYEDNDNQQSQLIFNEHEEEGKTHPRGNVNGSYEIKSHVKSIFGARVFL